MFGLTPYENRRQQPAANRPRDVFDLFFNDELFPSMPFGFITGFSADIKDLGKEYVIEAEMPGLTKDDIKMELNGDVLTIAAEKKETAAEDRGTYVRRERKYGTFTRSFRFEDVKKDEINAKFENGVLKVSLPKQTQEDEQKKFIDIN